MPLRGQVLEHQPTQQRQLPVEEVAGAGHHRDRQRLWASPIQHRRQGHHVVFLAMDDHSPRNLYMFRKNVVSCRRLPLAQIAQLFAFYREQKELATNMLERFALDVNRSLLDKLFISLATMIFAGERDKNLLWEQLKSLCAHGVSPRLLSHLDASSAPIWLALRAPNSATDVDTDADADALGDTMDLFDVGF